MAINWYCINGYCGYYINGYWWIFFYCIVVVTNGTNIINGINNQCPLISGYWWILY